VRRRLFNLAVGMSLVLCVLCARMWFFAYYDPGTILETTKFELVAWPGSLQLRPVRVQMGRATGAFPPLHWHVPRELSPYWISDGVHHRWYVPYWMPVALFAVAPAVVGRAQWRRLQRERLGLCVR
jgi:hypothetical protein